MGHHQNGKGIATELRRMLNAASHFAGREYQSTSVAIPMPAKISRSPQLNGSCVRFETMGIGRKRNNIQHTPKISRNGSFMCTPSIKPQIQTFAASAFRSLSKRATVRTSGLRRGYNLTRARANLRLSVRVFITVGMTATFIPSASIASVCD